MNQGIIHATLADITGLVLFSGIRDKPLIKAFKELLELVSVHESDTFESLLGMIKGWACFMQAFAGNQTFDSFYLMTVFLTLTDDNRFTHTVECSNKADEVPQVLTVLAKTDLSRLARIGGFDVVGLGFYIGERVRRQGLTHIAETIEEEARMVWAAEGKQHESAEVQSLLKQFPPDTDWGAALPGLISYIRAKGAGTLGVYTSFRWVSDHLEPVHNPDTVKLSDLAGYEDQRSIVIGNTLRFIQGKPANNLLLYGDRGTGKSATVKAVCNEYAAQGLRLLELRKSELFQLPRILDSIASRSLRFIIFVDDLSFEILDDSFTTLKMLLEGGIEAKPANVAVYATSNRRHLVKEHVADRPSAASAADAALTGDMRAFDTMQEQFSLADRFGLTVVFTTPGQDEYLRIAEHIALQRGILTIQPDAEERRLFRDQALRWERWFNGRSPRTAVQYVDWIAGGAGFPWE